MYVCIYVYIYIYIIPYRLPTPAAGTRAGGAVLDPCGSWGWTARAVARGAAHVAFRKHWTTCTKLALKEQVTSRAKSRGLGSECPVRLPLVLLPLSRSTSRNSHLDLLMEDQASSARDVQTVATNLHTKNPHDSDILCPTKAGTPCTTWVSSDSRSEHMYWQLFSTKEGSRERDYRFLHGFPKLHQRFPCFEKSDRLSYKQNRPPVEIPHHRMWKLLESNVSNCRFSM